MNICILTQYYLPEIGAPQARLSELASFLSRNGHDVTIVTSMPNYPTGKIFADYKGIYFLKEYIKGVRIIRAYIYPTKNINLIPRLFNYFSFVLTSFIAGLFSLSKQDIIMTESPPLFLGISGYLLSKAKNAKWIFNVSDLWPQSAIDLGVINERGFAFHISKKLEEIFYKKSFVVTGQSRDIISNINKNFSKINTYRFSNGVDVKKFHPNKKNTILKKWSNNKKYTVVYAGLHGIAQGLDQIINAALYLKKTTPNLQIILIGDGSEKKKLIDLSVDLKLENITFVDPLPSEAMPSIWASADVGIVTLKKYIAGAVPSKLYEVMSSSTPLLMVGKGEACTIVNKSKCGINIDPGDIESIAKGVKHIIDFPENSKILGENGRLFVKNNYDRENILKQFLKFINKICR